MRFITLMALILMVGCVHYDPAFVSTTSLGDREDPVAVVEGRSEAWYFLGVGPFGDDSLAAAMDRAMVGYKSDSMVNVFVDRRLACFPFCYLPLVALRSTMVTGTLVRYKDEIDRQKLTRSVNNIERPAKAYNAEGISRGDAVVIHLKDGRIIKGEYLYSSFSGVWLKGAGQNELVPKSKIFRLEKEVSAL